MVVNIYDNANEMASTLRQTSQYTALRGAFAKMKADPIAYGLFKDMQKVQAELEQKQNAGQKIEAEDQKKIRDLSEKLMKMDVVTDLMNKEREMNTVMEEVNKIVFKPISELYRD